MTRILTGIATISMVAAVLILSSCSDSGVEPTGFGSETWQYAKGDRLVYRNISTLDGEETSSEVDTIKVTDRILTKQALDLVFEDGSIWRVVDGTFEFLVYGVFRQVIGKVPAPSGRWPGYQDTLDVTNDEGVVIGTAFEVFTTVNGDTTISTPAGSFRCAVADVHYERSDGTVLDNLGRIRFFYAPGWGLVKFSTYDFLDSDGEIVIGEYSSELIEIL